MECLDWGSLVLTFVPAVDVHGLKFQPNRIWPWITVLSFCCEILPAPTWASHSRLELSSFRAVTCVLPGMPSGCTAPAKGLPVPVHSHAYPMLLSQWNLSSASLMEAFFFYDTSVSFSEKWLTNLAIFGNILLFGAKKDFFKNPCIVFKLKKIIWGTIDRKSSHLLVYSINAPTTTGTGLSWAKSGSQEFNPGLHV